MNNLFLMRRRLGRLAGLGRLSAASLIAVSLLVGCESIVDIDYPEDPPSITVNSIFYPGANFEVGVSQARSVRDRGELAGINSATVDLYRNGQLVESLPRVDDGLYRSPSTRPVAGEAYEVHVSAPGFEPVVATDYVPDQVPVEFVYDFHQSRLSDVLKAKIRLRDPPDIENYYRLIVRYRYEGPNNLSMDLFGFHTDDDPIVTENVDPFDDGSDDSSYFESAFFSDQYLEAGTHEIRLEIHAPEWVDGWFVRVEISLDVVSKSFYEYATAYRKFETFRDNPFKEPVLVPSNVEQGFGLFAGFNPKRFDIAF